MPQPVSRSSAFFRVTSDFTNATGFTAAGPDSPTTQNSNLPIDSPVVLLGVDIIPYTFKEAGLQNLTFANLILRNNRANPYNATQQTSGQTITCRPQDKLILIVFSQGNANVETQPVAYDRKNIVIPGPFLGGNTYTRMGVIVTATGACSGSLIAQLFYQPGS